MDHRLWLVMAGGAVGSGLRYWLGTRTAMALGAHFPFGTLAVNLLGCLLFSVVAQLVVEKPGLLSPEARAALTTGFCGGLTTYSTFNAELLGMVERSEWGLAALYLGLTWGGCLAVAVWGQTLAKIFWATSG